MSTSTNAGITLLESSKKVVKGQGEVWSNTGNLVLASKEAVMACEDALSIRECLYNAWTNDVDSVVPKTGLNTKGEEITLRHDGEKKNSTKGQIKFRAWEVTAQTAKGMSTIAGAIASAGFDAVFPNGKLIGKSACEELAKAGKAPEPAIKAIKRGLALIEQNLTALTDITEINEIDGILGSLMVNYNTHTLAVKAGAFKAA